MHASHAQGGSYVSTPPISLYVAYIAIYHRTDVVLALVDFINADVLSSDRDLIGELAYPCYEGECAYRAPICVIHHSPLTSRENLPRC